MHGPMNIKLIGSEQFKLLWFT